MPLPKGRGRGNSKPPALLPAPAAVLRLNEKRHKAIRRARKSPNMFFNSYRETKSLFLCLGDFP